MVVAACDVLDFLTTHTERSRDYRRVVVTFDGTVPELTLWIGTPAIGFAINVEGECAIGSAYNALDLRQLL